MGKGRSEDEERVEVVLKVERNFLAWVNCISLFGTLGLKLLTSYTTISVILGLLTITTSILCAGYMIFRYRYRIQGLREGQPLVLIDKYGPPSLVIIYCVVVSAAALYWAVLMNVRV